LWKISASTQCRKTVPMIGHIMDSRSSFEMLQADRGLVSVRQIVEERAYHTSSFEIFPECMASAH
jgi:hypothetical protein